MSFYSSSSFLSSSNSTYSCFNNTYNNSHSYYNDLYRSYSNLRSIPKSYSSYLPVNYHSLKRPPSYFDSKKTSDYGSLSSSRNNNGTSVVKVETKPIYNTSLTNLKIENCSYDDMSKLTTSVDSLVKDDSLLSPVRPNESNDLSATAVSNIQLNLTDDLMTQVDYYLNEVDNRMICSGRQVEIESYDLSNKTGLISRCLYINELLLDANLTEASLDSDPIFTQNGKSILIFSNRKDAEEFSQKHKNKFTVVFNSNESEQDKLKNQKKNVSFIESNDYTTNNALQMGDNEPDDKRSILKNSSKFSNMSSTSSMSSPSSKSSNQISSRSSLGAPSSSNSSASNFSNTQANANNENNILISANSSKKNKTEGYEILTIRAKLKQRVGQNRTKHVTLGDIDSIMRNVVTIIQDEFMKRFPSGPSLAVTNGSNSTTVSRI